VSITMLVTSMCAPLLNRIGSPRSVARVGFAVLLVSTIGLLATIRPELNDLPFAITMGVLGIGMGLLAAQLGNVAQSSVGDEDRSEVGGLQYTAQNLGSSLGTALIGSVVVLALTSAALTGVQNAPAVSDAVEEQIGVAVTGTVAFVPLPQIRQALAAAGIPPDQVEAIAAAYADAQLQSLKIALLVAAAIALASLFLTRGLPRERLAAPPDASVPAAPATTAPRPDRP
jgi:hypothetical protein